MVVQWLRLCISSVGGTGSMVGGNKIPPCLAVEPKMILFIYIWNLPIYTNYLFYYLFALNYTKLEVNITFYVAKEILKCFKIYFLWLL